MEVKSDRKYRPRAVDDEVERYLNTFGAVCVEGPKWCGKTWTSAHHSASAFYIGDPASNFQNRRLAEMSPSAVLEGESPRLLDEWQEVPSLWDAMRYEVDRRAERGQFILTGSSTPVRKGILHSGAGRIGKLRMRTMSLFESGDSSGKVSLKDICDGKFTSVLTGDVDLRDLARYVVRGGWPGNIDVAPENAGLLPESYINAILDDDVQRIDNVKYDIRKMRMLLRSLARNESTTATNKKLLDDIKEYDDENIDGNTLAVYLDVLNRLFLLDNQLPYSVNIRSSVRIKQSEKRHFCDPSLACALLKATPEKLIGDLNTFGFMFEGLCERDLKVYAQAFGGSLFHYQDYKNREIDAVIDLDGRWCAFEIKLGANQIDEAAAALVKIKDDLLKDGGIAPSVLCVICGLSNAAYMRSDGVYVVPVTALRP